MKPYTITPGAIRCGSMPSDISPMLRFTPECSLADIQRGTSLARALSGRYARGLVAFHLDPSAARKFAVLFDAGFSAEKRRIMSHVIWQFSRNGVGRWALHEAMRIAREEVAA